MRTISEAVKETDFHKGSTLYWFQEAFKNTPKEISHPQHYTLDNHFYLYKKQVRGLLPSYFTDELIQELYLDAFGRKKQSDLIGLK